MSGPLGSVPTYTAKEQYRFLVISEVAKMYLREARILNFRCLRDLTVTFDSTLNVIVGENNSGKTALFDALRAALGSAAATGDPIRLVPEDRHRNTDGTYNDAPIAVTLIFSGLTLDEQGQFIDILNYDPSAPTDSTAQINFRWSWNDKTDRYSVRRWGGAAAYSEGGIPEDVLQTLPVTLLGALRDAASGLLPGRNSRLAHLLKAHASDADKTALTAFVVKANQELEKETLISRLCTQ